MATAPAWAQALTAKVLKDRDYHGVYLVWHRRKTDASSGHCGGRRIVVTAGTSRKDAKLVLLHEVAHALNRGDHHGPKFWDTAWELYRDYGVNLVYAQRREFAYKAGARQAYKRIIGKRALRIKPPRRHRHRYEESKREPNPTYTVVHYTCRAEYGTGQVCGAWKCERNNSLSM